ncbi:MAG TPA: ATP-binding cassette domain-containing protein, partial [Gemmatimonadaceae bacterium]
MPPPEAAPAYAAPTTTPTLALRGVRKRFGATLALDGATIEARAGRVHALLGENGAGKTTLMRVAFGMVRPDAGDVVLRGRPHRPASPAEAIALGLGMVHQHFTLVPAMTVAENIALGGHGRFDPRAAERRVEALGEATGLRVPPRARVADLGVGAQQRVEILKALARDAHTLVLDEPTAVLAPAEARELLGHLRRFAGAGRAVVLITHKLRDALAVADEVTVLRAGRTVFAAPAASLTEGGLARAMLGEGPLDDPALADELLARTPDAAREGARPAAGPAAEAATGAVVARLERVTLADERGIVRIREATLAMRAGEIVGIAGVEGAGQRELLRALAGRLAPRSGTVTTPPRVGFVPEDRHRDALVLDFTIVENLVLAGAGARRGRIAWREEARRAVALLERHDVRASGVDAPARTLSGGNQQKLVLARELAGAPPLVVAENPTRGLDVRAAAAVHGALRAARAAGSAVVLHSSDLDEVLALADRV